MSIKTFAFCDACGEEKEVTGTWPHSSQHKLPVGWGRIEASFVEDETGPPKIYRQIRCIGCSEGIRTVLNGRLRRGVPERLYPDGKSKS